MLSDQEKYRYSRQIRLDSIGLEGQEKLKTASVLVIGAGGLGAPVLMYLAAAGIGKLGIVDFDSLDETNLHRQILYRSSDIGNNKAFAAAEQISQLNPLVQTEVWPKRLTQELALEIFPQYDFIVDASDNFSTRYLINDACVLLNKTFVSGSVYKNEGQLSVFNYLQGPTYRCLFPVPPAQSAACEEVGVLGVLCGIVGTKQAQEIIKLILNRGEILTGKLELISGLLAESQFLKFKKSSQKFVGPQTEAEFLEFNYPQFCGEKADPHAIDVAEFRQVLREKKVMVVDVRQDWEEPELDYSNSLRLPYQNIQELLGKIETDQEVILVCQFGSRSGLVTDYLRLQHGFRQVKHLKGGIQALGDELNF